MGPRPTAPDTVRRFGPGLLALVVAGCAAAPPIPMDVETLPAGASTATFAPTASSGEVVADLRLRPLSKSVAFAEVPVPGVGDPSQSSDPERAELRTIDRRSSIEVRVAVPRERADAARKWLDQNSAGDFVSTEHLLAEAAAQAEDLTGVLTRIVRPELPFGPTGGDRATKPEETLGDIETVVARLERATALRGAHRIRIEAAAFDAQGQPKGGTIEVSGYPAPPPDDGGKGPNVTPKGTDALSTAVQTANIARERAAAQVSTLRQGWDGVRRHHARALDSRDRLVAKLVGIDGALVADALAAIGIAGKDEAARFWSPDWLGRQTTDHTIPVPLVTTSVLRAQVPSVRGLDEERERAIFRRLEDRSWEAKKAFAAEIQGLSKEIETETSEVARGLEQIVAIERDAGLLDRTPAQASADAAAREKALGLAARLQTVYDEASRWTIPPLRRGTFESLGGSVDLSRYALVAGDAVEFRVTDEATRESLVHRFTVGDFGWNFSIPTAVVFTRQVRPGAATRRTFRPSPAIMATVAWRYQHPNWLGRRWNDLSPSVCATVAHVDFSDTREIEVAPAIGIGLFRNHLFMGFGQDVMVETHRNYYYFGFGFDVLTFSSPKIPAGAR